MAHGFDRLTNSQTHTSQTLLPSLITRPETSMIGPSAAALAAMKVILITGGNKGIGYAICKQLLLENPDVHVLLGSRDKFRGEQAIKSKQHRTACFASRWDKESANYYGRSLQ